jgi:hypothetical protein
MVSNGQVETMTTYLRAGRRKHHLPSRIPSLVVVVVVVVELRAPSRSAARGAESVEEGFFLQSGGQLRSLRVATADESTHGAWSNTGVIETNVERTSKTNRHVIRFLPSRSSSNPMVFARSTKVTGVVGGRIRQCSGGSASFARMVERAASGLIMEGRTPSALRLGLAPFAWGWKRPISRLTEGRTPPSAFRLWSAWGMARVSGLG